MITMTIFTSIFIAGYSFISNSKDPTSLKISNLTLQEELSPDALKVADKIKLTDNDREYGHRGDDYYGRGGRYGEGGRRGGYYGRRYGEGGHRGYWGTLNSKTSTNKILPLPQMNLKK